MSGLQGLDVAGRQHQRGVVKTFIMKLVNHVCELEGKVELTHTDRLEVKRLQQRLTKMDGGVKTYHLGIVDQLEEKEDLDNEQAALDDHNDRVTGLFDCLAHLAAPEEGEENPHQIHG